MLSHHLVRRLGCRLVRLIYCLVRCPPESDACVYSLGSTNFDAHNVPHINSNFSHFYWPAEVWICFELPFRVLGYSGLESASLQFVWTHKSKLGFQSFLEPLQRLELGPTERFRCLINDKPKLKKTGSNCRSLCYRPIATLTSFVYRPDAHRADLSFGR